ncbi:MAG TPA: aminotransferase class I/II-fold pyridoxal phosphate-dependent enzyme [Candidatus Limnocylindrales bacterium]|nr:aminotransferase class I/II-fold pyridoxal phosphate-dependent enzyme [Candidatus Limnocylindrales bacterium]
MSHRPRRVEGFLESVAPILSFLSDSTYIKRRYEPGGADFVFGNPQEMPLPGLVAALQRHATPADKDWFAYKMSEPEPVKVVIGSLRERTGIRYDARDVHLTSGAFGALAVAMRALLDEGDEVIFPTPPWFFYDLLIRAAGGVPVRVPLAPPRFDLDAQAIAAAVTPRTRAVIINSPHNPTGRVYDLPALEALAAALRDASARIGRAIPLISDESYNRIVFDGRRAPSPAEVYEETWTVYTYGKTTLAPGQRMGYLAVSPRAADRVYLQKAIVVSQLATGWAFPNALLQHAIEDIEQLSIDVAALQRRRDRLVPALRAMGYEVVQPEGAFYVMVRAPIEDDVAFSELLATQERTFVLPGTITETPGWFRISLTASDEMVERGLGGLERAFRTIEAASGAGATAVEAAAG